MKIIFQSQKNDVLKEDFSSLQSIVDLPCSFSHLYEKLDDDESNLLAVTIHGKTQEEKNATDIKFYELYFKLNSEERKIILLHELIHACQRNDILKSCNTQVNILVNQYRLLQKYLYAIGVKGDSFVKVKFNFSNIYKLLSFGIFELWDDLCFKEKYHDFFESNMNLVYSQISRNVDELDFTGANKYAVFFELLRADHYAKISQNLDIHKKFIKHFEFFKSEFSKLVDDNEFQYFNERLSELNSNTDFPDSTKLSKKYEKYVKEQWKNEIENDPEIQKIRKQFTNE